MNELTARTEQCLILTGLKLQIALEFVRTRFNEYITMSKEGSCYGSLLLYALAFPLFV